MIALTKEKGYRAVPSVSVSELVVTIKSVQAKGGVFVPEQFGLLLEEEVFFVRGNYSSIGVITLDRGRLVFKSSNGLILAIEEETDIIFAAKGDAYIQTRMNHLLKIGEVPSRALEKVLGGELERSIYEQFFKDWTDWEHPTRTVMKKLASDTFGTSFTGVKQIDKIFDAVYQKMQKAIPGVDKEFLFAKTKEVLRTVKNATYAYLKRKYPSGYVKLYRGVGEKEFSSFYSGQKFIDVDGLSGFTSNYQIASKFAWDYDGWVVTFEVPIENILISPDFKFSFYRAEEEWVVIGKGQNTKPLRVVKIKKVEGEE
ncbi:hypothetical protein DRN93_06060 [archaeon]|nr:MAG: hypothetical protein DRN93_06060 [archaeon]